MPRPMVDLTGQQFGRLTVMRLADHRNKFNQLLWHCRCECGNKTIVVGGSLRSGGTRSCGCFPRGGGRPSVHGHSIEGQEHPLWKTWMSMRTRCANPNDPYYGGRGIKVCGRWDNFVNFVADMGERPPGHVLDRINNDGNYEPSNVRWVTPKQSAANRRKKDKDQIAYWRLHPRKPRCPTGTISDKNGPMAQQHALRIWRQTRRPPLTQTDLARRLGLSRSYVHRIETGSRQIGLDLLPLICRRTGLTPEELRPDLSRLMRMR